VVLAPTACPNDGDPYCFRSTHATPRFIGAA
jgi:hypothetical protein